MAGRECYHCKQWVAEGQQHDEERKEEDRSKALTCPV
jgi:hypothetical protein